MSNYTKATNFATKDTLPTGNAGKIVKGTEIDDELNAIASAISSKANTESPTFTGTPAAPLATANSNTTQLATTAYVTAERTTSATLTNKTLTSPTITSPTITTPTVTGLSLTDSSIVFEGSSADAYETTLSVVNPTADRTVSIPDATTTLVGTDTTQTLTNKTISVDSNTVSGIAASSFVLSNSSGNVDGAAAQKAIPSGVVVGTTDTQTLTNKTLSADSNTLSGIAASSFVVSNSSGNIDGTAAQKAIPSGVVVGTTDTQTLTNKTVALGSNTVSGTKAQFNTAVTDTDITFLNDFTGTNQSLATSGYQKLPGGLILQWGYVASSNVTVTFPVAFTTACYSVTTGTTSGVYENPYVNTVTTTSFYLGGGYSPACYWMAIGK